MRERLVTLLLAIGALALFYALIFPKPRHRPAAEGLPLSTDARPDGYQAIWRWLAQQRIARVSLRQRYEALLSLAPARGNLLIVTLPQQLPADRLERTALRSWVARGNTLLIAAALDDEPLWAPGRDESAMTRFIEAAAGIHFTPASARTLLGSLDARHLTIQPRGSPPLMVGVERVTALLPLPSRSWQAHLRYGTLPAESVRLPLELAARSDNRQPALWLLPLGAGQIVLCALASPFSDAGMAIPGNARFMANLISWSRGPGGAVVFDDAHQGLAAFYDAWAFFADPRLHATLGWILIVWLIFVLGSQPLRPRLSTAQPPDESAYVEGSARYLAAVVAPADIARRLVEDFLRELPAHSPNADPWGWLDGQPRVLPVQRESLRHCYRRACAGQRVDLIRLHNLLAQLRRALL